MNEQEQHKFILELARTTPFPYKELKSCFDYYRMRLDSLKIEGVSFSVQKQSFISVVELSQATLTPLAQVINGILTFPKPTWFQRLRWWLKKMFLFWTGWTWFYKRCLRDYAAYDPPDKYDKKWMMVSATYTVTVIWLLIIGFILISFNLNN